MASSSQVEELIRDCWYYFKTATPRIDNIEAWKRELLKIDLYNAGEHISRRFKQLSKWPDNFPATVWAIYRDWVRSQPKAPELEKGCQYCMIGEGVIHAIKEFHGLRYVFAFNCGHCQTSDAAYPFATREWLYSQGYAIDWQHDFEAKDMKPTPAQREIVRDFAKEFGSWMD